MERTKKPQGKKFTTFHGNVADGTPYSIPVWLTGTTSMTAYDETTGFSATETDLETLRKKVHAHMLAHYGTSWEFFMVVRPASTSHHIDANQAEEHIDFQVSFLAIGTTTAGKKVWCDVICPFPNGRKHGGWRGEDATDYDPVGSPPFNGDWMAIMSRAYVRDGDPSLLGEDTMVPATVENVEAVRQALRSIRALNQWLKLKFGPKEAARSLKLIAKGSLLLPSGGSK